MSYYEYKGEIIDMFGDTVNFSTKLPIKYASEHHDPQRLISISSNAEKDILHYPLYYNNGDILIDKVTLPYIFHHENHKITITTSALISLHIINDIIVSETVTETDKFEELNSVHIVDELIFIITSRNIYMISVDGFIKNMLETEEKYKIFVNHLFKGDMGIYALLPKIDYEDETIGYLTINVPIQGLDFEEYQKVLLVEYD